MPTPIINALRGLQRAVLAAGGNIAEVRVDCAAMNAMRHEAFGWSELQRVTGPTDSAGWEIINGVRVVNADTRT